MEGDPPGNEKQRQDRRAIVEHDNGRRLMSTPVIEFMKRRSAIATVALPVVTFSEATTFHIRDEVRRSSAGRLTPTGTRGTLPSRERHAHGRHILGLSPWIFPAAARERVIRAADRVLRMIHTARGDPGPGCHHRSRGPACLSHLLGRFGSRAPTGASGSDDRESHRVEAHLTSRDLRRRIIKPPISCASHTRTPTALISGHRAAG